MIKAISQKATDKSNFENLKGFIDFAKEYMACAKDELQAVIVSQNENHYQFYQYGKEGNYQITRPINSNLMYDAKTYKRASKHPNIQRVFKNIENHKDY